jgi:hypothetical protein
MAERATSDRVASDMKPPNYRGAVQRLRTIKAKKDRIAGITSEIGGIFDTVEGFKVNKKAAKIFIALDALEADEQQDIFRSLTGLIDAAGWAQGDLVDQAEGGGGKIIPANFGGRKAEPTEAERQADIENVVAAIEEPTGDAPGGDAPALTDEEKAARDAEFDAAAPAPARETPAEKRARVKAAHAKGEAPAAQPDPEPYTGDNSDLVQE